jgi:hypothetical protein
MSEPRVLKMHVGIQRKDITKDQVYIGRGSPYGNPFPLPKYTRDQACDEYQALKQGDLDFLKRVRKDLRGKDLICFCKPLRCHGDFLLLVANSKQPIESFYVPN